MLFVSQRPAYDTMLAAKGGNRGKDTTDDSSTGGVGTAGGQWDEFLFDQELMTGYIDSDAYLL